MIYQKNKNEPTNDTRRPTTTLVAQAPPRPLINPTTERHMDINIRTMRQEVIA
jgi:hypothetical protein